MFEITVSDSKKEVNECKLAVKNSFKKVVLIKESEIHLEDCHF